MPSRSIKTPYGSGSTNTLACANAVRPQKDTLPLNSECVGLIHRDPPFNSNRQYQPPIGSRAAASSRYREPATPV